MGELGVCIHNATDEKDFSAVTSWNPWRFVARRRRAAWHPLQICCSEEKSCTFVLIVG
jgi:hypothetical protein